MGTIEDMKLLQQGEQDASAGLPPQSDDPQYLVAWRMKDHHRRAVAGGIILAMEFGSRCSLCGKAFFDHRGFCTCQVEQAEKLPFSELCDQARIEYGRFVLFKGEDMAFLSNDQIQELGMSGIPLIELEDIL